MRHILIRLFIASITFIVGVSAVKILIKPVLGGAKIAYSDFFIIIRKIDEGDAESVSPFESVSPYEIKRQIDDYNRGDGDKEQDLEAVWKKLRIDSPDTDQCPGCVQVELFVVEIDGKPGTEVILKLELGNHNCCRYLIFNQTTITTRSRKETTWKFIGKIDHDFNRYEMAEHRIFHNHDTRLLIIRGQTASGTGVASYDDTWYQVSEDGIKKVLTSMNSGHLDMAGGFARDVEATVITRRSAREPRSIEIEYAVRYVSTDNSRSEKMELFTKQQRINYVWDSDIKEYVFDSSRSEISEDELDVVYNLGSMSNEEFLKCNLDELNKIAIGRSSWRREWLRKFLATCSDTKERELLEHTLLK